MPLAIQPPPARRAAPAPGRAWRGAALLTAAALLVGAAAPRSAAAVQAPLPDALRAPLPVVPPGASGEGGSDGHRNRVSARLLSDVARARPGEPFHVGVLFEIDPGWHIYWRSPGDAGLPTALDWETPGVHFGPIEWPAPLAFSEGDGLITTYGYTGRVLLPVEARVEDGAGGPLRLRVTARFLVCEVECIPGRIALERELPLAAAPGPGADQAGDAAARALPAPPDVRALFEAAAAARPVPADALGIEAQAIYSQSAIRPGDAFEVALHVGCLGRPGCRPPALAQDRTGYAFIPDPVDGVILDVEQVRPHPHAPGDWLIVLRGHAGPSLPRGEQRLRGVVALQAPDSGRPVAAQIDLPLPRAPEGAAVTVIGTPWREVPGGPQAAAAADEVGSAAGAAAAEAAAPPALPFMRAILLALLGGLVLNLMPCVLPILAIKVCSIAEMAHQHRREVLLQGAAYAAGVVGSMLVLAAVVVALRAGGASVGWGFQFQQPLFVAAIGTLLVVFALNLFGVFEIFAPQGAGALADAASHAVGARRSFFEGLLAVVLATPCSAPFLGTAVGFAFAGSASFVFAIFAAIGVGLALPFVLVSLVPAWARFIPRSGPWMLTLRSALGFAVLAIVVWLLWVLGRLTGTEGVVALQALWVVLGFATWLYGRLQAAGRSRAARVVALGALVLAVAGLGALPLAGPRPTQQAHAAPNGDAARHAGAQASHEAPWSRAAVRAALDAGRPAFVYFTADWCITCKVNEHGTLASDAVRGALEELDVAVFVGDWTRRDEAIRAELARFGKAGVPLYLVYTPSRPAQPALLPELLTPGLLVDALREAARDGAPDGARLADRTAPGRPVARDAH